MLAAWRSITWQTYRCAHLCCFLYYVVKDSELNYCCFISGSNFKLVMLQELPKGKWFCCMDCERIFSALQKLLIRGEEKIPDSLLDVMKKKHEEKVPDTPTDFDVRWRVLSGKIASPETRLFLSKAVAIFHVSIVCALFTKQRLYCFCCTTKMNKYDIVNSLR